ncbi:hypothetical protein C0J52_11070 [Blattella germanica]|nr:hypothetical protein C0J52_11070 [Blattella germanica]
MGRNRGCDVTMHAYMHTRYRNPDRGIHGMLEDLSIDTIAIIARYRILVLRSRRCSLVLK